MAVGLPTSLQSVLQQLKKRLGVDLAEYDYDEQAKRRKYTTDKKDIKASRKASLFNSDADMAGRGLTQSGIALNRYKDINLAADKTLSTAGETLKSNLASLARKRLKAQTDYNLKKAELERQATGMTNPVPTSPVVPKPVAQPRPAPRPSNPAPAPYKPKPAPVRRPHSPVATQRPPAAGVVSRQ